MDNIKKISISQFNPYVRYVQRLEGATHDAHYVPWRILYDFEIIFVVEGSLFVRTETSDFLVEEGCLHIMPPFIKHTRSVPQSVVTNYYGVHLDFLYDESSEEFSAVDVYKNPCEIKIKEAPIIENLAQRAVYKPETMQVMENYSVKNRQVFVDLFSKLYASYKTDTVEAKLNTKAYMIRIIAEFIHEIKSGSENGNDWHDNIVSKFMDYTINHYAEALDLNKVVAEYNISSSRFRSIFKQKTQKAPLEYLIDYRMEQAKKLLITGKYSVTEICYMVGYDDIHYFSKLFKKREKLSPKEYALKHGSQ